jgi:hypothetical protein
VADRHRGGRAGLLERAVDVDHGDSTWGDDATGRHIRGREDSGDGRARQCETRLDRRPLSYQCPGELRGHDRASRESKANDDRKANVEAHVQAEGPADPEADAARNASTNSSPNPDGHASTHASTDGPAGRRGDRALQGRDLFVRRPPPGRVFAPWWRGRVLPLNSARKEGFES